MARRGLDLGSTLYERPPCNTVLCGHPYPYEQDHDGPPSRVAARLRPRLGARARGTRIAGQGPEANRDGQKRGRIMSMSATMPAADLVARRMAVRAVRAAERSA